VIAPRTLAPSPGSASLTAMSRWNTDDEIKPATVAGSLSAHVRVTATCSHCHRDSILDLDAMVAAGYGVKPLMSLPLRCEGCGGRGHGIIACGRRLAQPLGS
jgi:hypothetical protein